MYFLLSRLLLKKIYKGYVPIGQTTSNVQMLIIVQLLTKLKLLFY